MPRPAQRLHAAARSGGWACAPPTPAGATCLCGASTQLLLQAGDLFGERAYIKLPDDSKRFGWVSRSRTQRKSRNNDKRDWYKQNKQLVQAKQAQEMNSMTQTQAPNGASNGTSNDLLPLTFGVRVSGMQPEYPTPLPYPFFPL